MMRNSNRSGSVHLEPDDEEKAKKQSSIRSGQSTDRPPKPENKRFGPTTRKKIDVVDGELRIVDA